VLGVATGKIDVRLIDISQSGCLLESRREVAPGVAGEIRIDVGGRMLTETVRVTRCRHIEGAGGVYRLGTEFVRTRPLHDGSLRRALHSSIEAGTPERFEGIRLVPQR
jgi:hypothetical protein